MMGWMCAFSYGEMEITEEEEELMIRRVAEKVQGYGMETVAILALESVKPLVYVGGEMSRVMLAPFMPILGEELNKMGEKYIMIFENRANVERLIVYLEQMARNEYEWLTKEEKEDEESPEEGEEKSESSAEAGSDEKPWWKKWFPFI